MNATGMQDNRQVILKRVLPVERPQELRINELFSSTELAIMPHNHCVPLLDVIELQRPEPQKLMVFPLLFPFNQSEIRTFREFIIFFAQMCEAGPRLCPSLNQ
jgi:hypothetical protein